MGSGSASPIPGLPVVKGVPSLLASVSLFGVPSAVMSLLVNLLWSNAIIDEKGEIIFIVKKWRLAVLPIVLTSLYAALSVIVWMLGDPYTEARFTGMCIIVVPFIGVYVVYTAYWLTTTEPVFTINDQGLYDNTSPNGLGLIMWEEIKYMYVQKSRIGKGSLIIVPQNYGTGNN